MTYRADRVRSRLQEKKPHERVDSSIHLEELEPAYPSLAQSRLQYLQALQVEFEKKSNLQQWLHSTTEKFYKGQKKFSVQVKFSVKKLAKRLEQLGPDTKSVPQKFRQTALRYRLPRNLDSSQLMGLAQTATSPERVYWLFSRRWDPFSTPESRNKARRNFSDNTNSTFLRFHIYAIANSLLTPFFIINQELSPLQSVESSRQRYSLVDAYANSRLSFSRPIQQHISEAEFYGADFSNKENSFDKRDEDVLKELENLNSKRQVQGRNSNNAAIDKIFVAALSSHADEERRGSANQPEALVKPTPDLREAHVTSDKLMKAGLPLGHQAVEDSFDPSIRDRVGLTVFKIDNLQPVELEESEYGCFNLGDCYIVLDTAQTSDFPKTLVRLLYVWVGPEATPDKRFCVSMFSTVLRSFLETNCHIVHETPHEESAEFRRLFVVAPETGSQTSADNPSTLSSVDCSEGLLSASEEQSYITYQDARDATESALFKVTERSYPTKLYEVFGEREARIRLVERSPLSLKPQSVYILDAGRQLFQWNGAESRLQHRVKAQILLDSINKNERHGTAAVDQLAQDAETDLFFDTLLDGQESVDLDKDAQDLASAPLQLFQVPETTADLSSPVETHFVTSAFRLSHQLLKPNKVLVVDCGTEMFLWSGRHSKVPVREIGKELLISVIASKSRPTWTSVSRLVEGSETEVFKFRFRDWPVTQAALSRKDKPLPTASQTPPHSNPATIKADVQALYLPPAIVPLSSSFSETKEQMESLNALLCNMSVFAFERNVFRKLKDDTARLLSASECRVYFCVYELPSNSRRNTVALESASDSRSSLGLSSSDSPKYEAVVYFWSGRQSSALAWAHFQLSLKQELEELCYQMYNTRVRVVKVDEGKEPLALVSHLQGWLVVLKHPLKDYTRAQHPELLFQIQTDTRFRTTRFYEVDRKIKSLVSRDCSLYIDLHTRRAILWVGKGVSRDERVHAESRVSTLFSLLSDTDEVANFETVEEKRTPTWFYKILANGAENFDATIAKGSEYHFVKPPRMFRCHCRTGDFSVEEILYWNQSDLTENVCIIFDLGPPFPVYFWVGKRCSDVVCKLSRKAVQVYLEHLSDGRALLFNSKEQEFLSWVQVSNSKKGANLQQMREGDVIFIHQAQEPLSFTSFFLGWDREYSSNRYREPTNQFLRQQQSS